MWPRWIECGLAGWLSCAGFVLGVPAAALGVWVVDSAAALAVIAAAITASRRRDGRAHVLTLAVGVIVFVHGFVQPWPLPAWHENHILVGLLLVMFAVIPTDAHRPPPPWRDEGAGRRDFEPPQS